MPGEDAELTVLESSGLRRSENQPGMTPCASAPRTSPLPLGQGLCSLPGPLCQRGLLLHGRGPCLVGRLWDQLLAHIGEVTPGDPNAVGGRSLQTTNWKLLSSSSCTSELCPLLGSLDRQPPSPLSPRFPPQRDESSRLCLPDQDSLWLWWQHQRGQLTTSYRYEGLTDSKYKYQGGRGLTP